MPVEKPVFKTSPPCSMTRWAGRLVDDIAYHLRFCGFMPVVADLVLVVVLVCVTVLYL